MTPTEIMQLVFKDPRADEYAKAYARCIPGALAVHGQEGLKDQLEYVLANRVGAETRRILKQQLLLLKEAVR